jgi:hypothetical protein
VQIRVFPLSCNFSFVVTILLYIVWFMHLRCGLFISGFRGVLLTEILRYSSSNLFQGSGTLPKVRKELLLPLFPYSVQCLISQPVPKFAQHEEVSV